MAKKPERNKREQERTGVTYWIDASLFVASIAIVVVVVRLIPLPFWDRVPARVIENLVTSLLVTLILPVFSKFASSLITQKAHDAIPEEKEEEERARLAVAELFAARRERNVIVSSALVFVTAVSAYSLGADKAYYVLATVVLILLWSDQLILAYRIRHGYYATNQHEAREFLRFLIAHIDKTDFSDGNGMKKIFPTPEEIAAASKSIERLPGYAEA